MMLLALYFFKINMLIIDTDEIPGFFIFVKNHLHLAQWRYCFYLSRVRIMVSPWLLTWLANYKRASRSVARGRPFKISFTKCGNFIIIYKVNRTLHGAMKYECFLLVLKLSRSFRSPVRDTFGTRKYNSYPSAAM